MRRLLATALLLFALPTQAATVLHFGAKRTWVSPITPAVDSGWEDSDEFERGYLSSAVTGSVNYWNGLTWAGSSIRITMATSSANQEISNQFISPPMAGGITFTSGSTTVTMQTMMTESLSTDDVNQCILGIRVLDDDGSTVSATLLAVANYGTTTELDQTSYGSATTAGQNRNKTCANGDTVTSTYTTTAGDYLVVEVGFATDGATGSGPQPYWHPADNGSQQLDGSSRSDCPANETDTNCNAHIDFSNTITFLGDPNPGPTRLYLPMDTASAVNPAVFSITHSPQTHTFWEESNELERRQMSSTDAGSTTAEGQNIDSDDVSGNETSEVVRQYVTDTMTPGTTFTALRTVVTAQVRARLIQDADDLVLIGGVRVFSEDGSTVRATLVPLDFHWQWGNAGATTLATTATNESVFSPNGNTYVQTTYVTVAGDRLVYELGIFQRTVTEPADSVFTFGESDADCGLVDHSGTSSCSPWIEFSNQISFGPGYLPQPPFFGRLLLIDPMVLVRGFFGFFRIGG